MCVFCAAIPATLAAGVSAHSQQRKRLELAEKKGEEAASPKIPAMTITIVVVTGLMVGSVLYHSAQGG